jgi:hypothetical protein
MSEPGDEGSLIWWPCHSLGFPYSKEGIWDDDLDSDIAHVKEQYNITITTQMLVITEEQEKSFSHPTWDYKIKAGELKKTPICPKCGKPYQLDVAW